MAFLFGASAAFAQKASVASHSTVAKQQVATRRIVRGREVQVSQNENFGHVETMLAVNPADPLGIIRALAMARPGDTVEVPAGQFLGPIQLKEGVRRRSCSSLG